MEKKENEPEGTERDEDIAKRVQSWFHQERLGKDNMSRVRGGVLLFQ